MGKLEWLAPENKPTEVGYYMREQKSGGASELAYWEGGLWFHVKKCKSYGLLIAATPHSDQLRNWRQKAVKVAIQDLPGDRFGMLVLKELNGYDTQRKTFAALFRCDCGNEKQMNLYEVRTGNIGSCGCRRNAPDVVERQKEGRKKWRAENYKSIVECNRKIGKEREGRERNNIGAVAKWELNIHAKYWHFVHSDGREIKGWNLLNLIRNHAFWFNESDLVWKKGMCRASKGMSSLRSGGKDGTRKFWKGWQLISPKVT